MPEYKRRFYGNQTLNTTPLTGLAIRNQPDELAVQLYDLPMGRAIATTTSTYYGSTIASTNSLQFIPLRVATFTLIDTIGLPELTGGGNYAIGGLYERVGENFILISPSKWLETSITTNKRTVVQPFTLSPRKHYFYASGFGGAVTGWTVEPTFNGANIELGGIHFYSLSFTIGASAVLPSVVNSSTLTLNTATGFQVMACHYTNSQEFR